MEKTDLKTLFVLSVTTSMLLSMFTIAPARAQATTLGVEPSKIIDRTLQASSTFKVEVWVRNVANLYGVEFKLGYNTSVLTATLIEYGGIFGDTYWEWISFIDEAGGWLQYSVSEFPGSGEPPFTGDGRVANITFTVDSYGSCPLDLYETKLGDDVIPPNPIEHAVIDGYFSNKILGDVNGDGTVNSSDLVDLSEAYGSTAGPPPSLNWNPNCDFDWNGKVDALDLFNLGKNYGKSV